VMQQANKPFAASDAILSRCVSTAISLLWTEDQIKEKGERMVQSVRKVLAQQAVSA